MLNGKRNVEQLFCTLAFLLGSTAGCLTGYFCSASAISGLKRYVLAWFAGSGDLRCLTGGILFALVALLCSASVFGYLLIPLLDCFFGYCLTLTFTAALYKEPHIDSWMVLLIPSVLSVLPLLRISALTTSVSAGIARLWRSNGVRSFDLHGIANSIWAALLILFLLFSLRLFLYLLI